MWNECKNVKFGFNNKFVQKIFHHNMSKDYHQKNFLNCNLNHKKYSYISCIFRALVLKYTRGDIDEKTIHW